MSKSSPSPRCLDNSAAPRTCCTRGRRRSSPTGPKRPSSGHLTPIEDENRKLRAAVGLIEAPPPDLTIGGLLDIYLARADVKDSTKTVRTAWGSRLREHFGTRSVATVGTRDAEALRDALVHRALAGPTVGRVLRFARQLFGLAVKRNLIAKNPFDALAHNFCDGTSKPRDDAEADDVRRLLEHCQPGWRTLVALARFGALRCLSEAFHLRWEHVDLPNRRLTVTSPKTENQGKGWRSVPISPALAGFLEAAWELAEGNTFVVDLPLYRGQEGNWVRCNIRTQLVRLMKRASVPCWSRPFRVFRSSCVTDWAKEHPIHAVASWAGHTVPVVGKHYLTVTDADFRRATGEGENQKAAQNAAQQIPVGNRTRS